jgi:hypothetical protein
MTLLKRKRPRFFRFFCWSLAHVLPLELGRLPEPVSTGEPTTYLGWMMSGFWVTIEVSLSPGSSR